MIEIRFSPEAISDLQQTKTYITEELCSEAASVRTVANILKRIRMLSEFPDAGAALSDVVGFQTEYRYLVCGNYTAFYQHKQETIYVVRVLYCRRDFMRVLFDASTERS